MTECKLLDSSAYSVTACSLTVSLSQGMIGANARAGYQQYAVIDASVSAKVCITPALRS